MKKVFFQLHKTLALSLSAVVIIEVLSSLQVIYLIFQSMSHTFIKEQILLKGVIKVLPYFTGAFDAKSYSNSKTLVIGAWSFFMGYFLLHLFLLTGAALFNLLRKKPNEFMSKILGTLYLLHARLLFFPIQYFLTNIIILWRDLNRPLEDSFYEQNGVIVATFVAYFVNIILASAKEFILYKIDLGKSPYGAKTNVYNQLIFINKLVGILVLFYNLNQNEPHPAIKGTSIVYSLFGLRLMSILYIHLPFYKFQVLKTAIIMTTLISIFAFLSIIQMFVTNTEVLGGLQILMAVLPLLAIKGVFSEFRKLFEKILKGRFLFPGHSIHFALLIGEFVFGNKTSLASSKAFLPDYHKVIGSLSNKGIDLEKLGNKKMKDEVEPFLSKYIIENLVASFDKHPKSQILSIFIAQFYLEKIGNYAKTLELLRKLENQSLSLPMQQTIQDIYLELETCYTKQEVQSGYRLQIYSYFKYSNLTLLLKSFILKEIKNQTKFWEDIQKESVDLKKVADNIEEIYIIAKKVKNHCESNLEQFGQNFSLPILAYAVYLNLVKNSPIKSNKFLKKFQSWLINQTVKNEFDIYSEKTAAAIISLDRAKVGEILAVSGSIQNLFNFSKDDLIGKKFSFLFPPVIAQSYHDIVQQYAKSLEFNVEQKQKTYGKSAKGGLFEVEVHFQLYPYRNHEITLLAIMKKITEPEPILIIDPIGKILCCSKSLEEKFKKEAINITTFKMIQEIFVEFPTINKAFNLIYNREAPNQAILSDNSVTRLEEKKSDKFSDQIKLQSEGQVSGNRDEELSMLNSSKRLIPFKNSLKSSARNSEWIENLKQAASRQMSLERAQEICNKFLLGRKVDLHTSNESPKSSRKILSAKIQIKPYFLGYELHQVILFKNIVREFKPQKATILHSYEGDQTFSAPADEFSENDETKPTENIQLKKTISFQINLTKEEDSIEEGNESHLSKGIENISIEENQGKENLQAIMINKLDKEDQKSSIITFQKKETHAMKVIKQLSSQKKTSPVLKLLRVSLFAVIFIMLILCGVYFTSTKDSVFRIGDNVNIIYLAAKRLESAITSWQWSLIYLSGGVSGSTDSMLEAKKAVLRLLECNNILKEELTHVTNISLLHKLFEKDIYFWTSMITANNYVILDTFSASNRIAGQYLSLANTVFTYTLTPAAKSDAILLLNNTVNDYVLSSEKVVENTGKMLKTVISSDISLVRIILAFEISFLAVFSVLLILMAIKVVQLYKRLFWAITKTQNRRIIERLTELKRAKALFEQDIETRAFIHDAFEVFAQNNIKIKVKKNYEGHKLSKIFEKNFNLKKMNKYLFRNVCLGLIFVPVFIVLFVIWLFNSISTFQSFERTNEQVRILSDGYYQSSMLLGSLITKVAFSSVPTMKIRNQPLDVRLAENLKELHELNLRLSRSFLTGSHIDPIIQDILENDVCNYVEESIKQDCLLMSLNNKFGLLNLNTQYYEIMNHIYLNMGKLTDLYSVVMMFAQLLPQLMGSMNTIEVIYPFIIKWIFVQFNKEIDNSSQSNLMFFIAISICLIGFAIFVNFVPVRRLVSVDSERRKVFKIIPYSMIQENKALKFYLIQNYPKETESIKNVL